MRPSADDDDELVELSVEELASLRLAPVDVPLTRGWSTPTFACYLQPAACLLACFCPCAQFGINQRQAFGASCFKWTVVWLVPLCLLYLAIDLWLAPSASADELAVQHVQHEVLGEPHALDRTTAFLYAVPVGMALVGLVGAARRQLLRKKLGIGGTALGDFCCHAFCACCSLAKEAREIRRAHLLDVVAGAEQDIHEQVI